MFQANRNSHAHSSHSARPIALSVGNLVSGRDNALSRAQRHMMLSPAAPRDGVVKCPRYYRLPIASRQ